ncbi:hypothetical protein [Vibrio nigripulchritudo]|uniref:hypothetical protein n=1 Tax=Vibrio nigripulchritudo TaxID=28173 RepID=UPI00248F85F7|nr:hypothetical protein [Vibrio nigripulchritudo]BDU42888.1 hypothetical protein TUMSATVNIG3_16860 [Vibrio nigripulchritudo]
MSKPLDETQVNETSEEITQDGEQSFDAALSQLDDMDKKARGEETSEEQKEGDPDSEQETIDAEAATGMIEFGLYASEAWIAKSSELPFEWDEDLKEKFLKSCTPLIEKYGMTWLAFFEQYKEEIVFLGATGTLGFSAFKTLKRLQAEKEALIALQEKEAANEQGVKDESESTAAA